MFVVRLDNIRPEFACPECKEPLAVEDHSRDTIIGYKFSGVDDGYCPECTHKFRIGRQIIFKHSIAEGS